MTTKKRVKGNALQLERVKTINIGKSSTLMLLGDVFGIELTTVDRKLQKTTRVFVPRPLVLELLMYFAEVIEVTQEEQKVIEEQVTEDLLIKIRGDEDTK